MTSTNTIDEKIDLRSGRCHYLIVGGWTPGGTYLAIESIPAAMEGDCGYADSLARIHGGYVRSAPLVGHFAALKEMRRMKDADAGEGVHYK